MIVLKDIDFYSLCEHHILPFFGRAHVAYLPRGRIVGISKLARLVEVFARRLQVQERMTSQIANTIEQQLNPFGVGVVLEAEHLCMRMRGVEKQNSVVVTARCSVRSREHQETREVRGAHRSAVSAARLAAHCRALLDTACGPIVVVAPGRPDCVRARGLGATGLRRRNRGGGGGGVLGGSASPGERRRRCATSAAGSRGAPRMVDPIEPRGASGTRARARSTGRRRAVARARSLSRSRRLAISSFVVSACAASGERVQLISAPSLVAIERPAPIRSLVVAARIG
jgi:hypothetical protein